MLENFSLADLTAFIKENYPNWLKKTQTFALRVKQYEKTKESKGEIIDTIAKAINRKVNLSAPSREIFIERRKADWLLYFNKQRAGGGLPFASAGKVLCLVSGGIDSPVASYLMIKRGAENIWLHFHSYPLVSKKSIEKTKELAEIFLKYQPRLKLLLVPFQQIQMEIKSKVPPKYRVLLYRRFMLKIAEIIAQKQNYGALITGESLGQVSSQTLPNIAITEESVKIPILRPLIAKDKEEIIKIAKEIGTLEVSVKPQEDCCTLFTPAHSTAQGRLEEVKELEKEIDTTSLMKNAIERMETVNY